MKRVEKQLCILWFYYDDGLFYRTDIRKSKGMFRGRPTRVIFTSDHGEMLGNHGKFDKHAYCYEDVIRTPLLFCKDLNNCENGTKM